MQYSKILKAMLILPLPLIVTGCPTSLNQRQESIFEQSVRKAQIEELKIEQLKIEQQQRAEQQQRIIENNNRFQRASANQPSPPYLVNPPAQRRDIHRAQANVLPPVQQKGYNRGQDDLNRQATEAAQLEQARQNSLATQASEQRRRQERAAEEARQLEQARQNSLATHAREEARRQERAAEEARQIERATQESLRTHAEETARRQQAAAASQPAVPQAVIQPSVVPVPEWEPNSGHLVRAGELVMELKRSKGGISPTHTEMASHLHANMGVTAAQAEKILEELGL